jgi:hypothetical protein
MLAVWHIYFLVLIHARILQNILLGFFAPNLREEGKNICSGEEEKPNDIRRNSVGQTNRKLNPGCPFMECFGLF